MVNPSLASTWTKLQQQGFAVLEISEDKSMKSIEEAQGAIRAFFLSDDRTKLISSCAVPGEGYSRLSGKELLAFRLGSGHAGQPAGSQALAQACQLLDELGRDALRAVCRCPALGLHPASLEGLLQDTASAPQASASVLRCSLYQPDAHPTSLAFAPHHDRGVLTLVASNAVEGLQVWRPEGVEAAGAAGGGGGSGEWVDVPLGPGRVAVLAGYSLSYALGGLLQPVLHRVVPLRAAGSGPSGMDIGRISMAYELCCRPAAMVDPAAIVRESAMQPSRPVGRPLHVAELMELFNHTHPVSINGVARAAAATAKGQADATTSGVDAAATGGQPTACGGGGAAAAAAVAEGPTAATAAGGGTAAAAAAAAAGPGAGVAAQTEPGQPLVTAGDPAGSGVGASAGTVQQRSRRSAGLQATAGAETVLGSSSVSGRVTRSQARAQERAAAAGQLPGAATQPGRPGPQRGSSRTRAGEVAAEGPCAGGQRSSKAPRLSGPSMDATSGGAPGASGAPTGGGSAAGQQAAGKIAVAAVPPPLQAQLPQQAQQQQAQQQQAQQQQGTQEQPSSAKQEEERRQEAHREPPSGVIVIALVNEWNNPMGDHVHFKVRPQTVMQRVLLAYADKMGANVNDLRFVFDGTRLSWYATVEELGMKDGDQISVVGEQVGN